MVAEGDGRAPDVRFEFEHDRRAATEARHEVDRLLSEPDDPIADDVPLATSELVTNVVRHTDDGGELRAWDPRPDVPLRLEVEIPTRRCPRSLTRSQRSEAGDSASSMRSLTSGVSSNVHRARSSGPEFDRNRRDAVPDPHVEHDD